MPILVTQLSCHRITSETIDTCVQLIRNFVQFAKQADLACILTNCGCPNCATRPHNALGANQLIMKNRIFRSTVQHRDYVWWKQTLKNRENYRVHHLRLTRKLPVCRWHYAGCFVLIGQTTFCELQRALASCSRRFVAAVDCLWLGWTRSRCRWSARDCISTTTVTTSQLTLW